MSVSGIFLAGFLLLTVNQPDIGDRAKAAIGQWRVVAMQKTIATGNPDWGTALHTAGAAQSGAIFRCYGGKMIVAFSMEPNDLVAALLDTGQTKSIRVTYTIGDGDPVKDRWAWIKRHKMLAVTNSTLAKRMYNAALRGDTVTVKTNSYGTRMIDFPRAEKATFAEFRQSCNFTKKSR